MNRTASIAACAALLAAGCGSPPPPPPRRTAPSAATAPKPVTDDDIKPSENANPVRTLRMRYDAWKKAGSKPFSTVPTVGLTTNQ